MVEIIFIILLCALAIKGCDMSYEDELQAEAFYCADVKAGYHPAYLEGVDCGE